MYLNEPTNEKYEIYILFKIISLFKSRNSTKLKKSKDDNYVKVEPKLHHLNYFLFIYVSTIDTCKKSVTL